MAGAGLSKSRRLLRRVRKVMASSVTPQERLDQLVRIIATGFAADVCSAYVMRPGNILELFATKGLKRKAVHVTRLRVGEGVVGDIAAHATTLALSEASSHPSYSYRPETGEEKFHSMLGVPILRGGLVIGVLVVQHVAHRKYTEEESETLQTLAMILAEMVAEGGLVTTREQRLADGIGLLPLRLEGIQLSPGMASGFAVLHEPRLIIHDPIAEDPEVELKRLGEAMAGMFSALDDLFSSSKLDQGETGDILESYRMFAEDRGWAKRIREAVETGLIAEAAVQKVQEDTRARMSQIADPYLQERLHDFDDLANRLLRHLSGKIRTSASMDMPEDVILVARAMGPAELLEYDPHRLKALVLEEGSQTAHVAIIARDMDIPVLGHVKGALERIGLLEPLIVDTDNEQIIVRPGGETLRVFENNIRERAQRRAAYDALRDRPAVTRDGVCVSLNINAGLLADLPQMQACGADGIGLYRTEIPFMVRSTFPDVDAQTTLYKKVLDRTGGSPVVFRTLDVGSDKTLPYLRMEDQENPAMGWRSVRIGLDRPSMLRQQLRALIRAAARRHLDVTFPMIAEISEFMAAKDILQLELDRAKSRKEPLPKDIRIGSMIEVPALVWQLPGLKGKVDFLSVGSNDLIQFFFASDRGNPHLTGRYDTLSPAFLSLLRQIVDICNEADIALGLCGEMAGRPLEAMALVGLGFRNLSMSPSAMGSVKNMILWMECEPLREFLDMLCRSSDHSVRDKLRMYARDHGIAI